MKTLSFSTWTILICLSIFFSSCIKDDIEDDNNPPNTNNNSEEEEEDPEEIPYGYILCNIDGEPYYNQYSELAATLGGGWGYSPGNPVGVVSVSSAELENFAIASWFIFAFESPAFLNDFPFNIPFTNEASQESPTHITTMLYLDENFSAGLLGSETSSASMTITNIDEENKVISGLFEAVLVDSLGIAHHFTEGEFHNIDISN